MGRDIRLCCGLAGRVVSLWRFRGWLNPTCHFGGPVIVAFTGARDAAAGDSGKSGNSGNSGNGNSAKANARDGARAGSGKTIDVRRVANVDR